jgi:hypothetical protein
MPENVELQVATPVPKQPLLSDTLRRTGRPRGPGNIIEIDLPELERFRNLTLPRKGEYLRAEFAEVAHLVLKRAKTFVPSVSKQDFGKVASLMTAAGIAYDKVVPKGEPLGVAIQVNLFKGLSQERIGPVLGNDAVDVTQQTSMNTDEAKS